MGRVCQFPATPATARADHNTPQELAAFPRPMIAVLASPRTWADVQAAVGDRHRCILVREQDELPRIAGDAVALVLETSDPEPVPGGLRNIRQRYPFLPVILIIEQESSGLHALASVAVEAVILQHQIVARLPAALRRCAGLTFALRALWEEYMSNEAISLPLRHLLTCVLTSVPPPLTVQHLARLLHFDPSTIRRHWSRGVNSHGIQRIKDLLDWIVLLRALSAKRSGLSWRFVAKSIGLFPEAHESLLVDETWLSVRDWRRFAESLGIDDTSSFSGCMGEEGTQGRLHHDLALADVLQIVGTPTFASEEGLHPGAGGLGAAVAAAVRPPEAEANQSLVPGPSTFDSSELPHLADALSFIAGGFFLPDSGMVLVERTEVHFVDMASGETRVFGREGGGPHEFRRIQRVLRSPQGIALEDNYRVRVVFLDNSGEYVGDMRYNTVPFKGGVMDARPVAVHPDGRIVFRDREGKDFRNYRGRTWDAIEYLAVDNAGEVEVVAQGKGSEYHYEANRSGSVFFGHSTLMSASWDRVAIAETDQEAIQIFGWDGGEVGRIPNRRRFVRPATKCVRYASTGLANH